jgi:GT2 family glycosyltransferase
MTVQPPNATQAIKLIYVVTLTWNQKDDTLACLESLSQMTYSNYRLLLVDNASSDGTVEAVREVYPEVEIVVNNCNLGFPGGFNVGMQHALDQGAEYVLIINNDTAVAPDMLDQLVAEAGPSDVGMLAPKIYYADPPDLIWSVGGDCHPWLLEMTHKGDKQWDRGQWEQVIERDFLVGCALLFTRQMLAEVGMFDMLYYPIYYEDVDLCIRARRTGYRLLLVPQARMWHKVSASGGGADSPRERYLMARNSVRYFRKHVHGARWLAVIPWRTGSAAKTVIRLLKHGRGEAARAYLHGLWDGLRLAMSGPDLPSET